MSQNGIRDYSASLLASLLRFHNNKLISLDLSNNMLTKQGVSQLQLTIDDIPRIKTLNLDMNLSISHAQALAVKNSIARNRKAEEDTFIPRGILKKE